jgi:hypothetical protein
MKTPLQRLARMRKSFEKDKSVLTEDYKYFTTPDKPASRRESNQRGNPANVSQPDKHEIKEVVRAVGIEPTLLSEPDFEAGCVY